MKYVVLCICVLGLVSVSQADFVLWDNEQLVVDTVHVVGTLYDQSQIRIIPGGDVNGSVYAYDASTVRVAGGVARYIHAYGTSFTEVNSGAVGYNLSIYDTSTANVLDGRIGSYLKANDNSTMSMLGGRTSNLQANGASVVNISGGLVSSSCKVMSTCDISGGTISFLRAYDASIINISGGAIGSLGAYGGTITLTAPDFRLGPGLSLVNGELIGTGPLSGEWYDGTRWLTNIAGNSNATILLVPEPATLSLLIFGGLTALHRRRRMA